LAVVCGLLAAGLALVPAASAWGPREDAPVLNPSIIQPDSSLTLREDGSAVYLARGLDVGGDDVSQLVVRPAGGPATFASPFPSGFGQYVSSNNIYLSPIDAAGNLLVYRTPDPKGLAFLAPGADPAGAAIEPLANQITEIDLAPSGEAAAIVSLGSTAGVSFREAGLGGSFDAPRMLDRMGAMRSYGVGITVDPDGGVFVLYRTEQATGLLQTYAPPGGNFGPAVQLDAPATINDVPHYRYAQSTNGHGLLAWSEDVVDNSNRDQVWAATRAPGGLLGAKSLVAEKTAVDRLVDTSSAGITDDGAQYVGVFDAKPVSGCPGNADLDRGGAIAKRSGNGPWGLTREVGAWPNTSTIGRIATAGNTVGVIVEKEDDTGPRCESTESATRLEVRLGQGGSLGGPVTVASESGNNAVSADGFAVNAGGSAILLSEEPFGGDDRKRYIYFHQSGGAGPGGPLPGPGTGPVPPTKPLPAPGKIVLSGKKLIARDGDVPFEASCARLGPGDKVYCRIDAILLEQVKREAGKGSAAAKKQAKAKKKQQGKAKKPKVLARAKQVKIPAGKTKTVKLKLNKLGGKKLKRGGGRTPATLRVTIRKGSNTATIERKVTLKAGKAKKPGKGKGKGKGKAKGKAKGKRG
jgi:hypothetical protein